MRAAVLRESRMYVEDFPIPVPATGQVLVKVLACGICGSDLHFARHGPDVVEGLRQMEGIPPTEASRVDLAAGVFMGHEFAAEVVEHGPDTEGPSPGTIVTSYPALRVDETDRPIAYSNTIHAGYGETMLLTSRLLLEVTNGLPPAHAALTEPLAVGLHAVNRADLPPDAGALVMGSGPIGQAIITMLTLRGIEPVVAVDLSPARRHLAERMGAHEAIDPTAEPPFDAWRRIARGRPVVAFEATGASGVLNEIMRTVPARTRIVVAGLCAGADTIVPRFGINKELEVRFAYTYDRTEFAEALHAIAEGHVDISPLVTGEVDLDGIQEAFDELANPEGHCKIIVTPRRP